MDEKNRVRVKISGLEFNIVGEEDEEYMRSIADKLSETINAAMRGNTSLNKSEVVILVALNLASELEKERRKNYEFSKIGSEENLIKLQNYDKNIKELERRIQENKDYENIFNNYKKMDIKYKEKEREFLEKIKELEEKYQESSKLIKDLSDKLELQEKINFKNNNEIINIKRENRELKGEFTKLEK